MHSHDHDHDQSDSDSLRIKSTRAEAADSAMLGRAVAAGRTDVVGSRGMLALQRAAGNSATRGLAEEGDRSPVLDVVSSGGQPLEEPVRTDMEGRLGHSFSDVRVHTGDAAHNSATSVNAHAYTVGSSIVFQRDKYDPGSDAGRTMIAHELTHVVQQRSGPVDGTATGTGVRVSDPSDRFEREAAATAERAMSAPAAPSVAQRFASGTAVIQRDADEETAQGSFTDNGSVQREEEEEDKDTAQGSFVDGQPVQRDEADEDEPG